MEASEKWPSIGQAESFVLTKITDTSGPYSFLAEPAINNSGFIVFRAGLDAGRWTTAGLGLDAARLSSKSSV